MHIFNDTGTAVTHGSVCAIGSFDGVHLGHQAIVNKALQIADRTSRIGVITFIPLPFFVLKNVPPIYLTVKQEKEGLFKKLGVDFIFYFTFDEKFATLTPDVFSDRLSTTIAPAHIVVGSNFHFGVTRTGSAQNLITLAGGRFQVHVVPPIEHNGTISSTRIRELLLLGHVVAANELLGREYSITGEVIKGRGKGSTLGFPTINVRAPGDKLLPLDGIYAARVHVGDRCLHGALFLRHDLVEVHIVDYHETLYGQEITVNFVKRIRGIESFADDASLSKAIADDVASVRRVLKRASDE